MQSNLYVPKKKLCSEDRPNNTKDVLCKFTKKQLEIILRRGNEKNGEQAKGLVIGREREGKGGKEGETVNKERK